MNAIDILLLLLIAINIFNGARKGLIRCLFDLLATIISIVLAIKWYMGLASFLINTFYWSTWPTYVGSFLIVWAILFWIISQAGQFLHQFIGVSFFSPLNIAGGLVFGFAKGVLYALIIIIPLSIFPLLPGFLSDPLGKSVMFQQGTQWFNGTRPYMEDFIYKGHSPLKGDLLKKIPEIKKSKWVSF